MDLTKLFQSHIAERQSAVEKDLAAAGYDALVLSSGAPYIYFRDDTEALFHPAGHFAHWCPMKGPHHVLRVASGNRPLLTRYAPEDYWYEQKPLGDPYWASSFDLVAVETVDAVWEELATRGIPNRTAYVGNETERAEMAGLDINPARLLSRLDWARAYKTDYEISCLEEATRLGAEGHKAARKGFETGASELDIHYAFVQAMNMVDDELPYTTIIAFNEKSAILHYQAKRDVRDARVLLIDAGSAAHGYASDITRTYTSSDCDARFVSLREGMERLQQELCADVKPGLSFVDLHLSAHAKVGALLKEVEVLRVGADEAVSLGLTRPFLPHGLGHHLGLQVHDVGGHQSDPDGEPKPPPPEHPFLRNTRTIEERQVFTIEPGLYFIPMLLRSFREGEHASHFNWALIDELTPLGGIRVEDNVVVTADGHRNLTRQFLP